MKRVPVEDRILASIVIDDNGCWLWQKYTLPGGYGAIRIRENGKGKTWLAHRSSYVTFKGEIPEGLELDHLCRVRHCVNPDHLEPVTHTVNMRRSPLAYGITSPKASNTHCVHGHEYTPENTLRGNRGTRSCKACHRIRNLRSYHRVRQQRLAA